MTIADRCQTRPSHLRMCYGRVFCATDAWAHGAAAARIADTRDAAHAPAHDG